MAKTPSTMLPLGTPCPDFSLIDTHGKTHSTKDYVGKKPLLVAFICNHCPFVLHIRSTLAALTEDYMEKGIAVLAINSNDVETHPDDAPDKMVIEREAAGYRFPYLFDETQSVAKAFQAACTPDFFLFDKSGALVYRGQFDDSRPGNGKAINGKDLKDAMDAVLKNTKPSADQKSSLGCNIKWKAGNEPAYYR